MLRFNQREGGVDAHFGGDAAQVVRGLKRRTLRSSDNEGVEVSLDTGGDRPLHIKRVQQVDVLVDNDHMLEIFVASEGG